MDLLEYAALVLDVRERLTRGIVNTVRERRRAVDDRIHALRRRERALRGDITSRYEGAARLARAGPDGAEESERQLSNVRRRRTVELFLLREALQRARAYREDVDALCEALQRAQREARREQPGPLARFLEGERDALDEALRRGPASTEDRELADGAPPSWAREHVVERFESARDGAPVTLSEVAQGPVTMGEWMRIVFEHTLDIVDDGESVARAQRIAEAIQKGRPSWDRRTILVVDAGEVTAFAAPGAYIYLSQALIDACSDDALAFVIGHEIAHHDLGHLSALHDRVVQLPFVRGASFVLARIYGVLERLLHSPENECDADRVGLALALRAGFHGPGCLTTFTHLGESLLRHDRAELVFGPEPADHAALERARRWLWERKTGYLPIEERREHLEAWLREIGAVSD